jgi:hypothetical protein
MSQWAPLVQAHWRMILPEREVMTGIGTVSVQVPRVRDRGSNADGSKIKFRSALVPPYLRKSKSVEELLPWASCMIRGKGFEIWDDISSY